VSARAALISGPYTGRTPHRRAVIVAILAVLTLASAGLQIRAIHDQHGRMSTDEHAYLRLARDLHERGHWGDLGLKQPFRWAPGTPMVFAGAAALTGRPVDRDSAVEVQVIIGTLIVPATFVLALLLAGPIPGLVAAAAVAAYAPLARASATAGTETLGALMIVLTGIALTLALRTPGVRLRWAAAVGVVLGAAALVRGDLVAVALALPVGLGIVAARASGIRHGLAVCAVGLAGALALMGPWSVYASGRAHRFVPVTDGGAANFFIGTYLPADGSIFGVKRHFAAATRRVHPAVRHVPTHALREQLVLDAVAAQYPGRSRSAALQAAARDNLRRYALGHPLAFAGMELRKLWRMWGGAYAGTLHRSSALTVWEHRVFALFALIGLVAGIFVGRDRRMLLLAALIAITTAIDVVFVSEARHNVRLMPVLLAAGAAGWWMTLGRGYRRSAAALGTSPVTEGQPSAPQRTPSNSALRSPGPASG
jgi:4-amino-4-deoxy-L-arabinose transferase-like glycosyltransferase